MTGEKLNLALEAAYLAGFNASGEGYNGEYPFSEFDKPEQNATWIKDRDNALRDRLAHCDRCGKKLGGEGDIHTCTPKHPAQRTWVGLTDEEIKEIVGPWGDTPIKGYTRKLFDQIEAKLREKNHG